MKLRNLLLMCWTLCSWMTFGQQFDSIYGRPLIVLTETDPWAEAIGSDVPTFVLYEHGQIIYKKHKNEVLKLFQITLKKKELDKVVRSFRITKGIYKLPGNINISGATDQPTYNIYLNLDSMKFISVYGRLTWKSRIRVPKKFLRLYHKIKKYNNRSAKEWLPNNIEVMFWDYNYAPNKSQWPDSFPDLNSPTTIKHGNIYSVYIDKKYYSELSKYYSSMGEKEAVEISGRKMTMSLRFPFPNID